jgi:Protein of unknown function (DUF1492).
MTTKDWLNRAYVAEMQIQSLEAQKQKWRDTALRITSGCMSLDKVVGGIETTSRTADCVNRIVDIERDVIRKIDEQITVKEEIAFVINLLDEGRHKTVLEYRYLCFMSWDDIADIMHYDRDSKHVYYLHRKALKILHTVSHLKV